MTSMFYYPSKTIRYAGSLKILQKKLERNGYRAPIYAMIRSYQSDRWQHLLLNGIFQVQ